VLWDVTCGIQDVDVVTIGFHFGVWNVKMDIFQSIRSSAACDCGRTRNVALGKQDNSSPWNLLGKSHKYIKYSSKTSCISG